MAIRIHFCDLVLFFLDYNFLFKVSRSFLAICSAQEQSRFSTVRFFKAFENAHWACYLITFWWFLAFFTSSWRKTNFRNGSVFQISSHKLEQIAPKETNVRLTSLVLTRIFSPHMKIRCVHVQTRSVCAAQWLEMAKNPPKISSLKVISRVFLCKSRHTHNFHFRSLRDLHFQNLSNIYIC